MAVHPLRPAMDRRLGGLLSHQLANLTRVHPIAINLCYKYHAILHSLCGISVRFQTLSPSIGQVTHALLTRPPLALSRSSPLVRLACVKHAASVHPEPGSNSRYKFETSQDNCLAIFSVLPFRFCSFLNVGIFRFGFFMFP